MVVRAAGKEAPPEDAAVPLPASMWLNTTLYYLISEAESRNRTDNLMLARLVELMFVEVLRHYMQHQPADRSGWLSGLKDPHVGRALELMHAEPARNWTVEELARRAGVSRSALADRFTALIGASPMRYLTDWRIQLSKQLLSEGNLNLAEIAARVGYDSEYSFNRAFRRHVGHPPAAWHKRTATDEPRRASAAH